MRIAWQILAVAGGLLAAAPSYPQDYAEPSTPVRLAVRPALKLPIEALAQNYRDRVVQVTQKPTLTARAAPEEFAEGIYNWLLDHPDRASLAWRRLGIPCAEIGDKGQGRFGWTDKQGTEVTWLTVAKTDQCRVWYAEGRTRLGPMMPAVAVRAVVVLSHTKSKDRDGRNCVAHVTDVYLQTDSKAAAAATRLLGPMMPRLADQGAEQLLLFFSGLTRYFDDHPEDINSLLAPKAARKGANP